MGTRADFYVGLGPEAEWLGSIAWDGYLLAEARGGHLLAVDPDDPLHLSEDQWRADVASMADRADWTSPEQGWPWPWADSRTTDYAYAFVPGEDLIVYSIFGEPWMVLGTDLRWAATKPEFPDMTERQAVTYGSRSGVMLLQAPGVAIPPEEIDAQEAAKREEDG